MMANKCAQFSGAEREECEGALGTAAELEYSGDKSPEDSPPPADSFKKGGPVVGKYTKGTGAVDYAGWKAPQKSRRV